MTWMGKVTILNAYYKDYKYDTFSDKFEPNGRLHNWLKTIVYEVKVDEIYLDDGKIKAGDIFKVEQNSYNGCSLTDSALFDLKINHQYILPLFYAGEKILYEGSLDSQNYADGDITRDGYYSIVYPFAPQIEVTLDNEYIFHDEWLSLINDKTVDVIMPYENDDKKDIYPFASNEEVIQEADFNDSNLIIMINDDIYKPMPVNMKIYFDEKLCLHSNSKRKNEATISSSLNITKTNHVITVTINDKINSSLIIEAKEEKQWVIIEYSNPGALYSISNEPPMFD